MAQNEINWLNDRPYTFRYYNLLEKRKKLPVYGFKQDFMEMLAKHRVLLVKAKTGAGKTTQIPQWCLEFLHSSPEFLNRKYKVLCSQPQQIAAMSIAARVAKEMDVKLGEQVGFQVRFESACNADTQLLYCTDGKCLSEALKTPNLAKYGVVVLDEVHKRSHTTDVLLGLVQDIRQRREDLRVVVMSTSLTNYGDFATYFGITDDSAIIRISERQFPLEIIYEQPADKEEPLYYDKYYEDDFELAVRKVLEIHRNDPKGGDILVFLTGKEDVEMACERIEEQIKKEQEEQHFGQMRTIEDLQIFPLFASLSKEEKKAAIIRDKSDDPPHKPPNNCASPNFSGHPECCQLQFYERTSEELLNKAISTLTNLGVIDADGRVTVLGKKVAELPVDPQMAIMLIKAAELGCLNEALSIAAMLDVPSCFYFPHNKKERRLADLAKSKFVHPESDHFTLLNVFNAFVKNSHIKQWHTWNYLYFDSLQSAVFFKQQLVVTMKKLNYEITSITNPMYLYPKLRLALLSGFFLQIACFDKLSSGHVERTGCGNYIPAICHVVESETEVTCANYHEMRKSLARFDIHGSSVLGRKYEHALGHDWVLYDSTDGRCLRTVTAIKYPGFLVEPEHKNIYDCLSILCNSEFRLHLNDLEEKEKKRKEEEERDWEDDDDLNNGW